MKDKKSVKKIPIMLHPKYEADGMKYQPLIDCLHQYDPLNHFVLLIAFKAKRPTIDFNIYCQSAIVKVIKEQSAGHTILSNVNNKIIVKNL
jgi:hypothetical protein